MTLLESPLAQRLTWTLLHFLWQGALLGLCAWGAFILLRRARPQLRYLAGCACLLACLSSASLTFAALAPAPGLALELQILLQVPEAAAPTASAALSATSQLDTIRPWRQRLQPALPWVLTVWIAGVLLLTLRAAGSWLWLRRLKATARPVAEPEWLDLLVQSTGLRRTVRFLESVRVATPMCMGLLRPVVLLPLGFFTGLDPMAAEAVLAHELAHIRRMDALVNGAQCLLEVLFFFHPAVWWISRRIRAEREHCCDDAAVLACGDAVLYAETLSRLDACGERPLSPALLARGGNLMERMRRLLLAEQPRLRFTTPGLLLVATLALVAALPVQAAKAVAAARAAEAERPAARLAGTSTPAATEADTPAAVAALPEVTLAPAPDRATAALVPQVPIAAEPAPQLDGPVPVPQVPTPPALEAEAWPIETRQGWGAVFLPAGKTLVQDVLAVQRAHAYAVRVPAGTTMKVRALSAKGEADLRLRPQADQRGVSGLWPGLPEATFSNGGRAEQVFIFYVYFVPEYAGPRDVLIQQTLVTPPVRP
ncbi:MAG: M56 family metallopeptidase [Holophagaceae bacterium]|nr:M56 family metallopeptidase [Holophagaceae bacterium]